MKVHRRNGTKIVILKLIETKNNNIFLFVNIVRTCTKKNNTLNNFYRDSSMKQRSQEQNSTNGSWYV